MPQGSILGPTFIVLYINDICNAPPSVIQYADDANTFITGDNVRNTCRTVFRELYKLSNWFKANKLLLNLTKTSFIVFLKQACKS